MNNSLTYVAAKIRIAFWRAVASLTRIALKHKREIYMTARFAPVALVALAAFVIGRGVGVLIGTGLF